MPGREEPLSAPHENALAREASPYLRQHARNPVDWHPWGERALARARSEDRPIFLSIGYAACHWCHVMERESFEDPATAAVLNEHFVSIKVDREERPDLDAVYMAAVQSMTGSGGWPLNVFLSPDQKPFFGGTYFPPERRHGMASFREVLLAVADAWRTRRREVEAGAENLAAHLSRLSRAPGGHEVDLEAATREALATLDGEYDERWGGFGAAPKFPSPSRLFFLLDRARHDERARTMLTGTLDGMAAGGMYDWLGGGFHRYSVDREWLVPHFEKMLYDNALLVRAYGEAGLALGRDRWVEVARETADYLLREMRGPEGAFYSSTDADSEGREGAYFTWTPTQIREALPTEEADLIVALMGPGPKGNFEGDASVLRPRWPLAEAAAELRIAPEVAGARLDAARTRLRAARADRVPPSTDDKRLAAWNGMAVWALAWLGAALPEPRYLGAAREAAAFLLSRREAGGRLVRSWREGVASGVETLEDVAWVSAGFVQLFEADGDVGWLTAAKGLIAERLPHYRDASGVLHDAADDGPALIVRPRDPADGAVPASSGVAATTLARLAALTDDASLRAAAERAVGAEAALIARAPAATATLLLAARAIRRPPTTLVIVGDPRWESTKALLATAWRNKPPDCAVALARSFPVPESVASEVPLFSGRATAPDGKAAAYLCLGGACGLPIYDAVALTDALASAG